MPINSFHLLQNSLKSAYAKLLILNFKIFDRFTKWPFAWLWCKSTIDPIRSPGPHFLRQKMFYYNCPWSSPLSPASEFLAGRRRTNSRRRTDLRTPSRCQVKSFRRERKYSRWQIHFKLFMKKLFWGLTNFFFLFRSFLTFQRQKGRKVEISRAASNKFAASAPDKN